MPKKIVVSGASGKLGRAMLEALFLNVGMKIENGFDMVLFSQDTLKTSSVLADVYLGGMSKMDRDILDNFGKVNFEISNDEKSIKDADYVINIAGHFPWKNKDELDSSNLKTEMLDTFYMVNNGEKLERSPLSSMYLYNQIVDYREKDFLSHMKKHLADYNKDLDDPNPVIFSPDFPIDKVVKELKSIVPNDKRTYILSIVFRILASNKF